MPSFVAEWRLAVCGRYCFIIDFAEVDEKVQRRAKASSLTFEDVDRLSKSGKTTEYSSYMASYQAEGYVQVSTPPESAGVRRNPADSAGFRRSPADSGGAL